MVEKFADHPVPVRSTDEDQVARRLCFKFISGFPGDQGWTRSSRCEKGESGIHVFLRHGPTEGFTLRARQCPENYSDRPPAIPGGETISSRARFSFCYTSINFFRVDTSGACGDVAPSLRLQHCDCGCDRRYQREQYDSNRQPVGDTHPMQDPLDAKEWCAKGSRIR